MRPRSLIVDLRNASLPQAAENQTYEQVRRTLDDALAELELEIELDDQSFSSTAARTPSPTP
jgi:hypothetical protein